MLVARYALGSTGGHCDNTGFPSRHVRRREPGVAEGIATARTSSATRCRLNVKYGADVIKICASGGVLSLGDDVDAPQLTARGDDRDRRRGAPPEAQDRGARPRRSDAARSAIKAGIDSIEHGSFLTDETLALDEGEGHVPRADAVSPGQYTGGKPERFPPAIAAKAKAAFEAHGPDVPAARSRAASRSRSAPTRRCPRTASTREEFGLMVDLGMTPGRRAAVGDRERRRAARPVERDRHAREGQGGRHRGRAGRPARRTSTRPRGSSS